MTHDFGEHTNRYAAAEQGESRRSRAAAWFEALRDRLCSAFESIEDELTEGPYADRPPGRFVRRAWERPDDSGGGAVGPPIMHGRVFEKVGVNVLGGPWPAVRVVPQGDPGAGEDGRFWASGISLVAHMQNPLVPAAHMNTRYIATRVGWFGGGADLTPTFADEDDTATFHSALRDACAAHDADYIRASRTGAIGISICRIATRPAVSEAYSMTGSTPAIGRRTSPSRAMSATPFSASIPDRAPPLRRAVDRGTTADPTAPPRAIRGVQPAIRSRNGLRPKDRRRRGGDPDVVAATGGVALIDRGGSGQQSPEEGEPCRARE